MPGPYPKIDNPPIIEVVCGFLFEEVPLDVLDFGAYHEVRSDEFPGREIREAIIDQPGPVLHVGGPGPLRVWLLSPDRSLVLQLQHNRFFVNWKRQGEGDYPRFSDDHGPGIKMRAIREFEHFARWAEQRGGFYPEPTGYDLTKIDRLTRGVHYETRDDLARLLPLSTVAHRVAALGDADMRLKLDQGDEDTQTLLSLHIGADDVTIETRCRTRRREGENHDSAFVRANDRVNDVFFDEAIWGHGGAP